MFSTTPEVIPTKRNSISIRLRIAAIAVVFSLVASIGMVGFAYVHFRASARQNLLQSTEFNLSLVAGLIDQSLQELNRLRSSAANDTTIAAYLASPRATSAQASRAYEDLADLAQSTTAYRHLLRILLVSDDHRRILQTGSGTSSGHPVNPDSLRMLENLPTQEPLALWQGIAHDPFTTVDPAPILVSGGDVYQFENMQRRAVGSAWLMVSLNLVQEPLRSYQLPQGSRLYLTVGENTFALESSAQITTLPKRCRSTDDPVLNSQTRVTEFIGSDNTAQLAITCPIGSTGMYLSQTISQEALSVHQSGHIRSHLAALPLLAVAIGSLLMLALNRMIGRPLKKLLQRMNVVAQGNFVRDPSVEWNNELGEIGRGINDLACNMQDMMERRVADEKARQELEYEVLLNQVNPHFLYNTLNSIKWMATIQQAPGIAEMTSSLARLLKTVSRGRRSLIPLSEELSLLEDYFVIQRYRYGGAITITQNIDPRCLPARLPRFTLQPLLENAVFHGIEPKGGVGAITLTAALDCETMTITLEDDGVGIPAEQIPALLSDPVKKPSGLFRGIGLSNVHSRIRSEFGPDYGLKIESQPGSFTRILLRLPYLTESEQEG